MTHRLTSCTFPPARCVASWLWGRLWHTDAGMHTAPVERWQVSHTWAQITKYNFQSDSRDYRIITAVYHFSLGDYFSHLWLSAFRCLSAPGFRNRLASQGKLKKILGSFDIFNIYICSAQESWTLAEDISGPSHSIRHENKSKYVNNKWTHSGSQQQFQCCNPKCETSVIIPD